MAHVIRFALPLVVGGAVALFTYWMRKHDQKSQQLNMERHLTRRMCFICNNWIPVGDEADIQCKMTCSFHKRCIIALVNEGQKRCPKCRKNTTIII